MFEARNEYDIFADICERLGDREAFTEGKEEMDWIREFYASAQDQGAAMGIDMPDFDSFWEQGDVRFEVTEEGRSFVRYADFRDDPLLEPLGTPTGLIEIYSRNIEKMGYEFCPPHPTWIEPVERLDGPGAAYPLHVLTSHPRRRLHSQLCGTKLREGYAVAGREPCLIHPDDAAARGISDGDVVRVFNDRGQLLAGAVLSDALRPGVIRVNEGGWYDPVSTEPGALDAYGDVQQSDGRYRHLGVGPGQLRAHRAGRCREVRRRAAAGDRVRGPGGRGLRRARSAALAGDVAGRGGARPNGRPCAQHMAAGREHPLLPLAGGRFRIVGLVRPLRRPCGRRRGWAVGRAL